MNNCTVGRHSRGRIYSVWPLFGGRPCSGEFTQSSWCVVVDCVTEGGGGGGGDGNHTRGLDYLVRLAAANKNP